MRDIDRIGDIDRVEDIDWEGDIDRVGVGQLKGRNIVVGRDLEGTEQTAIPGYGNLQLLVDMDQTGTNQVGTNRVGS